MKIIMKRAVSVLLTICLLFGITQAGILSAAAEEPEVCSIKNGSIIVNVSTKNGGFTVTTESGDKLNKADDNKNLLYHDGKYDTSFTSFEVTYSPGQANEHTEQYVFGGKYGFLGMSSSAVTVTQNEDGEIVATWSLDNLFFTQSISLAGDGMNEHGMVCIKYDVKNNGSVPVSVKARVLLDTALGNQDYAYYQVIDSNNHYRSIKQETVLTASDSIPQNFYAHDDPYSPSVTAYTVSSQSNMPYQVAFGHWNNLASTVFSFTPDSKLDFTNAYNASYLTADSAYALYYDLSNVSAGTNSSFLTYYGVYSHKDVSIKSDVAVDVSAPASLTLNGNLTGYVRQTNVGIADFSVQVELTNRIAEGAKDLGSITLAVYTADGLMPLDTNGAQVPGISYGETDPYNVFYSDVSVGETISRVLYFSARADNEAKYRKIRLEAYDTSSDATLTEDNLLGSCVFYVLCPGTNGELPTVSFSSMSPNILYYSGTRHLFLTGTNIDILYTSLQNGNCTLKAYTKDTNDSISLTIPKENIIQSDPDKLDIMLTEKMVTGGWYLQLEWSDAAVNAGIVTAEGKMQTAPALEFTISDDKAYRNDIYGVVAVVQTAKAGTLTTPTYRIKTFPSEAKFQEYAKGTKQSDDTYVKDYVEILLVLRGEFEVKETVLEGSDYVPTVVTATSLKSSVDADATNCITINNCIDFEDGVITVKYASTGGKFGNIRTEFNGRLYTSNSRTSIWKGEAIFTEIVQGEEFSLIPYDEDGVRDENFKDNTVGLVWPSVFGVGQTIAGMVFNLAYGQLGIMNDSGGNELGRVISFSAKLDLGFLIPGKANGKDENTYWSRLKNYWKYYEEGNGFNFYSFRHEMDEVLANEESGKDKGAASVMVSDILFGCGKGLVGVHFKANIALPNYVSGLPKIEGSLEVNTISNWSIAMEGKLEFVTFTAEAKLKLKSYKNIPVPDTFYVFIGGFEPGVNIDCNGIIWITGGGGGFDKLYETIFNTGTVPPLKLLLSVSFDLMKVLSARADLSLSLRGVSLSASDIKIKYTNLVALQRAAIEINWFPDLYLMGSIKMSLFDIINGSGYIVLEGKNYKDWFFEAFVRAGIQIPASIPIVGGMSIAQVDLGLNAQKVWGNASILLSKIGIIYYWGGDVHFGSEGSNIANPTYPSLLGLEDIPVYYDEELDQTLYMRVGTNLTVAAKAEITDDFDGAARLMGGAALYSSGDKLTHRFNLGARSGSDSAVIQISYNAADLNAAKDIANTIISGGIKNNLSGLYAITLYNGSNVAAANANVTFDSKTGKGALCFTITDDSCYNKDWDFKTPVSSDVIIYNLASVPEITSVSGSVSGNTLDASWDGSGLNDLDSVKFYLVTDNTDVASSGYVLGELTDTTAITAKSAALTIPANIPSGSYYIKAVYSQDGIVNSPVISSNIVTYVNSNTPQKPKITDIIPAGDLKFAIDLDNPAADAYIVNIYEHVYDETSKTWSWETTDINGMAFNKADIQSGRIAVGGSYFYDGKKYGLSANTDYRIGLTACNYIDSDSDGKDDTAVYDGERYYSSSEPGKTSDDIDDATSVTLPEPTAPKVNLTAVQTAKALTRTVGTEVQSFDTYTASDLEFNMGSDTAVTGTWILDEDIKYTGSFNGQTSVQIALSGIGEGDHTLIIKGNDSEGDGFYTAYSFTVDTLPPKLLLSSPANGSFFNENGTLTVTGVTDLDTLFSLTCDGNTVCDSKSISGLGGSIDSDGKFSFTVALPKADSASSHKVVISVSDTAGNVTAAQAEVFHGGLSDIERIDVYADGTNWSNANLITDPLVSRTSKLTLVATTKSGFSFVLTDEKTVSWVCTAVEGKAAITDNGLLTMGADSVGFVTGSLHVASSGSLQANLTFGAESFSNNHQVVAGNTIGGTVAGGGTYKKGETVTLTATAKKDYTFAGWTVTGVTVSDSKSATITFTMPDNSVVATAVFADNRTYYSDEPITSSSVQKMSIPLPAGADENSFAVYYVKNGQKVYITKSAVTDGKLVFLAPAGVKIYQEQIKPAFTDASGHWAENYVNLAFARGLFNGMGDGKFKPDAPVTRAMFITVLWRLEGEPSSNKQITFMDTAAGHWYSEAVAWALEKGIIYGYDKDFFGTDDSITREQMSTIFLRYLNYIGFDTAGLGLTSGFADQDSISSWALDAVNICRGLGLINGKGGNLFEPESNATRAESCAVFYRLIRIYLNSLK